MKIYYEEEVQLSFHLLLDPNYVSLEEEESELFKLLANVLDDFKKEEERK